MKSKTIVREAELVTFTAQLRSSTARFNNFVNELKEKNLPLYWDLIYRIVILGEGNPIAEYSKRLADSFPSMLDKQETATAYARIMPAFNVYTYVPLPVQCIDKNEDGSFEVNKEKREAFALAQNSFELNGADLQIIEAYNTAIAKLLEIYPKSAPLALLKCAMQIDGKLQISPLQYTRLMGKRPIGNTANVTK